MPSPLQRIAAAGCELGEGPVWRPEQGDLLFTDIIGRAILRWRPDAPLQRVALGRRLGAFAPCRDSDALLAVSERAVMRLHVDFDSGAARWESLGVDAAIDADQIMNDGCCDAAGLFVFGSKALNESDAVGSMMRYGPDGLETLQGGFIVFNGPAFDPERTRVYYADTPSRRIMTARYDSATGAMGEAEVFAELAPEAGYPDGMTVDVEGCLWNAHWDGWRITRYRPDGSVERVIEAPVSRPTSLAFGGADLKTLFVTSARRGRDDAPPASEAGAGDLYAIALDVAGRPEPRFAAK